MKIPPAERRARPRMHQTRVVCICCGGIGGAVVSVNAWGPIRSICFRCNIGNCDRIVTNAPTGSPGWGCRDNVDLPVLQHHGRRWG